MAKAALQRENDLNNVADSHCSTGEVGRLSHIFNKLVLALPISACSMGVAYAQEITMVSNQSATSPFVVAFAELTEEYNAATGASARLSFDAANQANIMQRVQILAASDSLPLLMTLPDRAASKALYESGRVINLVDTLSALGVWEEINPVFVAAMQDGEGLGPEVLFEWPVQPLAEGISYNTAIFAEHGIEPPRTWEEFLAACETLLNAGIQPITAGGSESWPLLRWISMYAHRKLGVETMDQIRHRAIPLTDPGMVEAVEAIEGLVAEGYFGPAVATMNFGQSVDQFAQGQAAMVWGGSFIPSLLGEAPIGNENVGIMNFPLVPDGVGVASDWMVGPGLPIMISTRAYEEDAEAIDAWLAYVVTNFSGKAQELGFLSANVSDEANSDSDGPMAMYQAILGEVGATTWPFEEPLTSRGFILAGTSIPLVVTGQLSAEQYLADLEAANTP